MIDDILEGVFGEVLRGRVSTSRRAQLLARVFVGLLGTGLGLIGAVHMFRRSGAQTNGAMSASMVAMFVCLACFFLFNVALGRAWRWPWVLFGLSFVSMVATRILFG
ncbi:MAG TPA: hypothetical protein VJM31_11390 [Vicinamibacterales bacterium]|nr:hypothetical protein [Vicinamibacterales bacterium]